MSTNNLPGPNAAPAADSEDVLAQVADFAGNDEHPILQIPFNVMIDGRSYTGTGLSLVSALAKGLSAPHLLGHRRIAVLQFNFEGYTVNLPTEAHIETASSDTGSLVLRFLDPTGPQLPQLRYLLNSFVAGDLVQISGLLSAPGATRAADGTKQRQNGASWGTYIKRTVSSLAIVATSVALAAIVSKGIHDRYFVMEADGLSVVTSDGMTMRALSAGQVDFINTAARVGEPLVAIRAVSGDAITLTMPCDCRIIAQEVVKGATVLAGEPLVELAAADAKPIVRASLSADAVRAIAAGAAVEIEFPDGRTAGARLAAPATSFGANDRRDTEVTLLPRGGVSIADLGAPVKVKVSFSLADTIENTVSGVTSELNQMHEYITHD